MTWGVGAIYLKLRRLCQALLICREVKPRAGVPTVGAGHLHAAALCVCHLGSFTHVNR